MKPVRVAVLAFEGVSLFHLSVPGIVFGVTPAPAGLPPYEVSYCAPDPGLVRCDQGMEIEVPGGLGAMDDADIVIVPAWNHPENAAPAVLSNALRQAHARGAQVVVTQDDDVLLVERLGQVPAAGNFTNDFGVGLLAVE